MVIVVMTPSPTETLGVESTAMSAVPNVGVAVTFAAGFATVGVDIVGVAAGIDDDVGRTDVSPGDAVSPVNDPLGSAVAVSDDGIDWVAGPEAIIDADWAMGADNVTVAVVVAVCTMAEPVLPA